MTCQTCGGSEIIEAVQGRKVWEDCPECGGMTAQVYEVTFDFSGRWEAAVDILNRIE